MKDFTRDIAILKANPVYRLGDVIYRRFSWLNERKWILGDDKYKGTLLYDYVSKLEKPFDLGEDANKRIRDRCLGIDSGELLVECAKKHYEIYKNEVDLRDDKLNIHIRSGDIISLNKNNLFINDKNNLYQKIEKITKEKTIKEIEIVTALHFGHKPQNHPKYRYMFSEEDMCRNLEELNIICEYIEKNFCKNTYITPKNTALTNFQSVDKDFIKLCFSKNVILENYGGFSNLVNLTRNLISGKTEEDTRPKVDKGKSDLKIKSLDQSGLFSYCSINLFKIIKAFKRGIKIKSVKFENLKIYQKEDDEVSLHEILFDDKYQMIDIIEPSNISFPLRAKDIFYKNTDIKNNEVKKIIKNWFNPREDILKIKEEFINKYNISPKNTIGLYYRGTDTTVERKQMTRFSYIYNQMIKILNENEYIENILLQTDDKFFQDYILDMDINKNIKIIKELPAIYSTRGYHFSNGYNKIDHAKNIMAVTLLLSECDTVLCNTSNLSRWINIFRDNSDKFYQCLGNRIMI